MRFTLAVAMAVAIWGATSAIGAPALAQTADSGMDLFEFDSARSSFFEKADRDGDLALTGVELSDALGFSATPMFDGRDSDGDGLISYSEYLDSGTEIFSSLDRDGNGFLTMEEF